MIFEATKQEANWTLRKWARYHLPHLTYPVLSTVTRKKDIKLNNASAKLSDELLPGDKIYVHDNLVKEVVKKEIRYNRELEKMIIFENNDYLIIEKPYDVASQGEINSIAEISNGYIVHRLDKTTTGLMIVAKTKQSADFFCQLFRNNEVKKQYQAICIAPEEKFPNTGVWKEPINSQEAITYFSVVDKKGEKVLLSLEPKTGRKHQLRIHCAANNLPILGDTKYGRYQSQRVYLHCHKLLFIDAQGNKQIFESKSRLFI